ncbi:DUF2484 family protein [Falsirhodobacter sp. alg1]|uniref:DUF2484 family protein n=1 Tax=Falsirhodobacter sp. alg1 TaxID=1472418 RepID=UPI0005EFF2CE|nr:DUF2484 family protein [Falsirhodobacter sp. alg1]
MTALIFAALWFTVAIVASFRVHAPTGWALVLTGIPMVGMVTWQSGPLVGLVTLAFCLFLLRTPLRAVRRRAQRAVQ